ncbi:MAG: hypothetical protein J3R72DRAFT_113605 [Linnemannia gamsii]|nr:MAG: hypothetical protein J3R72DRAFT_113605 [Linnemannia gamsii]
MSSLSQHLAPQRSPYAPSISSTPASRSTSPAPMLLSSTTPVPSSPLSPSFNNSTSMGASNSPTVGSQPTSGTSTIISIGGHSPQQQHQSTNTTSTVAPSDFSAHSPTLFSSHTIASLLFYQPITRVVVVLTILQSLLGVGVKFPDHCSAPSYTLYGGEFLGLLMSPFVVPLTPALLESAQQTLSSALMLAMSNLISLGLFEERLTMLFRGGRSRRGNTNSTHSSTRLFRNLVLVIVVLVMALRELAGFVFNRAVGFMYPSLYFSDSVHECNLGKF